MSAQPLVSALALALALALGGAGACGSSLEANFTGLEIQTRYPRDLGLETIRATGTRDDTGSLVLDGRFGPLPSEGEATLMESLLVTLPPELAGVTVTFDLFGLRGESIVAEGTLTHQMRLGVVDPASVTLSATSTGT